MKDEAAFPGFVDMYRKMTSRNPPELSGEELELLKRRGSVQSLLRDSGVSPEREPVVNALGHLGRVMAAIGGDTPYPPTVGTFVTKVDERAKGAVDSAMAQIGNSLGVLLDHEGNGDPVFLLTKTGRFLLVSHDSPQRLGAGYARETYGAAVRKIVASHSRAAGSAR